MSFVASYRRMAGLSTPRPPGALDCPCGEHDCAGWVLPLSAADRPRRSRGKAIALLAAGLVIGAGAVALAQDPGLGYLLDARRMITAFPVATVQPTQPGKAIAFDVLPSAGAAENPDNGFAWLDVCDADVKENDNPVACARAGVKAHAVEFGSRNFNGAAAKPVDIIVDRRRVARFEADGTMTVFGTVRAQAFETIPPAP